MTASLSQNQTSFHSPTSDPVNAVNPSHDSSLAGSGGLRPVVSVSSPPLLHLVSPEGQLQVHTAPYRGSFAGVLSQALRTAGLGSRVLIAQFLRGGVNQGPDGCLELCGRLKWVRPDVERCLDLPAMHSDHGQCADEDARSAVIAVWNLCREHLLAGDLDHLVLDELGLAIELGYLTEDEVLPILERRPGSMDVILTGTSLPMSLISIADQVTELRRGF